MYDIIHTDFLIRALFRSSHRRYSVRKDVLRNSAKFAEKHLCQSSYFNKAASLQLY